MSGQVQWNHQGPQIQKREAEGESNCWDVKIIRLTFVSCIDSRKGERVRKSLMGEKEKKTDLT